MKNKYLIAIVLALCLMSGCSHNETTNASDVTDTSTTEVPTTEVTEVPTTEVTEVPTTKSSDVVTTTKKDTGNTTTTKKKTDTTKATTKKKTDTTKATTTTTTVTRDYEQEAYWVQEKAIEYGKSIGLEYDDTLDRRCAYVTGWDGYLKSNWTKEEALDSCKEVLDNLKNCTTTYAGKCRAFNAIATPNVWGDEGWQVSICAIVG